jgi:hypothetical protein
MSICLQVNECVIIETRLSHTRPPVIVRDGADLRWIVLKNHATLRLDFLQLVKCLKVTISYGIVGSVVLAPAIRV